MRYILCRRRRIAVAIVLLLCAMAAASVHFACQMYARLWRHTAADLLKYTQTQCTVLRTQLSSVSAGTDGALTLLSHALHGENGTFCILNAQGEILFHSGSTLRGNLFDLLNNGENEVPSVARFASSLRQGWAGTDSLRLHSGKMLLCYAPIEKNTGLFLVLLAPARMVLRQTGAFLLQTFLLILCLMPCSFLLAVFYTHHTGRVQRLLDAKTREQTLRNAQMAEALSRAKSNLLSSVSHDIRTPMNAIVGLATLLGRDAESPQKVREHAVRLASASRYLLGLVNDVLDMSRIESGKTALRTTAFNLCELVDSVNTVLRPQMDAKKQRFLIHVQGILCENLIGDKLRINQILFNLLSNAAKYTPDGGEIHLLFEGLPQEEPDQQRIRITVRDNGIGISPDYLSTIFNPFTREANSATQCIQGTGLGMAITKDLVDLMGGEIRVESECGAGSTFTVELTLGIAAPEPCPSFWREHGIRRLLILCTDEPMLGAMLHAMEGTGVEMMRATGMADAERLLCAAQQAERTPDLVLLGPQASGAADTVAAARICSLLPAGALLIALDDGASPDTDSACISAYIHGPFFAAGLRKTVERLRLSPREEASGIEAEKPLNGMQFLVAEDNELNAEIITELLHMAGAACTVVPDGHQAVSCLTQTEKEEFDMVLMDVQMPIMNGYDATRAIRSCDQPGAREIPIIAMTANAFAEDVSNAIAAGMNAHIAKPVELPVLVQTVLNLRGGASTEGQEETCACDCSTV